MKIGQIYFNNLKNLQLLPIFLHFFCFYLTTFPPGSGSRSENECGSGSTALVYTDRKRGTNFPTLVILVSHKWSIYILTFGWFGLSEEFCRPDQTPAGFPFKLAVLL